MRIIILYLAIAAVLFLLVWYTIQALLTIFGGVLFAIFLRGLADLLAGHTRLSRGWALVVVIVVLGLLFFYAFVALVPRVAAQIDQMMKSIPRQIHGWENYLNQYEWGRWVIRQAPEFGRALLMKLNFTHLVVQAVDFLVFAVVVAFIGIYVSARPSWYRSGVMRLIPEDKQVRANGVLYHLGETMRWWMIGRAVAMTAVGILDWIGLALVGFPLALSIAVLSGVLTFIPYVGALLSLIPAVIIALGISPGMALAVLVIHTVVQTIEGYIITPMVQRRAVHLPPALTVSAQFFLGYTAGVLGLTFATPLTAMIYELVRRLYLREEP